MFVDATIQAIQKSFYEAISFLQKNKADVLDHIKDCDEEEQMLLKFLYACMPISDIADYDFQLYHEFVKHALFLKKNIPWCLTMPDDIFLNYVLFYRINNEDVTECRGFFYDCLQKRISGKTMVDAALEVNYWCLENVIYRSTDIRTASPLTVLRTGSGRCGEE